MREKKETINSAAAWVDTNFYRVKDFWCEGGGGDDGKATLFFLFFFQGQTFPPPVLPPFPGKRSCGYRTIGTHETVNKMEDLNKKKNIHFFERTKPKKSFGGKRIEERKTAAADGNVGCVCWLPHKNKILVFCLPVKRISIFSSSYNVHLTFQEKFVFLLLFRFNQNVSKRKKKKKKVGTMPNRTKPKPDI